MHLRKVRLRNLEHPDDARGGATRFPTLGERHRIAEVGLRALNEGGIVLLCVVVPENLERHLHALEALLEVGLRRAPRFLLGHARLVGGLLLRGDLAELLLEERDGLLQLRDLRGRAVDLRVQVVDLLLLVGLLGLGLRHLLDHALDLREGVGAHHAQGADAHGELREGRDLRLLREALDQRHHAVLDLAGLHAGPGARADLGVGARADLEEARVGVGRRVGLELVVGALRRAAGLLLDDLLRGRERRELLRALLLLGLVVLRLGHALVLEVLELLLVGRDLLLHALELAGGDGLVLLREGLGLLALRELLLLVRHGVLQRLLEHLEVVVRLHLRLLPLGAPRLRLLEDVLHRGDDAAALGLVGRRVRSAAERQLILVLVLEQRRKLGGVGSADATNTFGHDERAERVPNLVHRARLQEASLAHLLLKDRDRAAEHVNGLGELRIGRVVVRLLLLADCGGGLEVLGVRRDRRRELADLRLERRDLRLLVRDGGCEALRIGITRLQLELSVFRRVLAEISELLIEFLRLFTVFDDLRLEVSNELNNLLDWRDRGCQSAANREEKKTHCSYVSNTRTRSFLYKGRAARS